MRKKKNAKPDRWTTSLDDKKKILSKSLYAGKMIQLLYQERDLLHASFDVLLTDGVPLYARHVL